MKNLLLSIASLSLFCLSANAGGHVGNGGDAIVCYDSPAKQKVTSIKMFDHWEQDQVLKYPGGINLGNATLSLDDKINIAANRIAKFDPELADFVRKNALNLSQNINAYITFQVPDIDDANPQVIPTKPNCYIEQFAVQYKDVLTGQRRFSILDKIYNNPLTSNDDRAGLLLHEAIYRYAILKSNVTDSDGVRYFNYVISTDYLESLALTQVDEYVKILANSKLDLRGCIKIKDFYVNQLSKYFSGRACYNQVVQITPDIKFMLSQKNLVSTKSSASTGFITASSEYIQFGSSFDDIEGIHNVSEFKVIMTGPFANEYQTKVIKTDYKYKTLSMSISQSLDLSKQLSMLGPINKSHACKSFELKYDANEVLSCYILTLFDFDPSPSNQIDGRLTKLTDTTWQILNLPISGDLSLAIEGSKQNRRIFVKDIQSGFTFGEGIPLECETYPRSYEKLGMVVNHNYHILSTCVLESKVSAYPPILINNKLEHIGSYFQVSTKNGKSILTFMSSSVNHTNPKLKNLRLIDSSSDKKQASLFCKQNNHDEGTYTTNKQYINSKSEQFYDLATKKEVYKTDEDVDVIDSIQCSPQEFSTDTY